MACGRYACYAICDFIPTCGTEIFECSIPVIRIAIPVKLWSVNSALCYGCTQIKGFIVLTVWLLYLAVLSSQENLYNRITVLYFLMDRA